MGNSEQRPAEMGDHVFAESPVSMVRAFYISDLSLDDWGENEEVDA